MILKRDNIIILKNYKSSKQISHQSNITLLNFCQKIQHNKYQCNDKNNNFLLTFKNNKCFCDLGFTADLKIEKNNLVAYWQNSKPYKYTKFIFSNDFSNIKAINSDGTIYNGTKLTNYIKKYNNKTHTVINTNNKKIYFVVSAYNINKEYIFKFIERNRCIFTEFQKKLEIIILIDKKYENKINNILPNIKYLVYPENQKYFSIGKTINYGIRYIQCSQESIIVKTDIDIVFSDKLIDYLYMNVKKGQGIIALPSYIKESDLKSIKNSLFWLSCNKRMDARGACFALTRFDWYKLNGYDERLYGWGGDDTELYLRASKKIKILEVTKFPIYHVNHPTRINNINFIHNSDYNMKISQNLDWSDPNWGKLSYQNDNILSVKKYEQKNNIYYKLQKLNDNNYTKYEYLKNDFLNKHKKYEKKCSIIIPTYNRLQLLKIHLEALKNQTYPLKLIEVVIADDGSSDGTLDYIKNNNFPFNIKYVYQKDLGYRLSKIRNEAIKKATNEIIIISDVDMIPTFQYVEYHMIWHHICNYCAIIGHRRYTDPKYFQIDQIKRDKKYLNRIPDTIHKRLNISKDWRLQHYYSSNMLKTHTQPWRYLCGGNLSMKKEYFFHIGLFDEDFKNWGGEDQEFAYRVFKHGLYFIPELKAEALHVEHNVNYDNKIKEKSLQLLENKRKEFDKKIAVDPPSVSVYIPCYNREKYIKQCIESVINQTFKDIEIIICDDGSSDKSKQVIYQLMEIHNKNRLRPIIKLIEHKKNYGIAKTWNDMFRECKGKYLLHLDGDDYVDKNTIDILIKYMDKDTAIVYAGCNIFGSIDKKVKDKYLSYFDPKTMREVANDISPPRLINRTHLFKTELCNENYINAVDYDLLSKVSEQGKVKRVEKYLYYYRQHGNQITKVFDQKLKTNKKNVIQDNINRYQNKIYKKVYVIND